MPAAWPVSRSQRTASSGTLTLGYLVAQVPNSAVNYYKTQELLKLSDAVINGGSTTAVTDDGIQVVAYLGDVTGTGSFSPLDAALLERVAVNLGTGFTAYPLLDPAIVGGLTGSGNVNSTDVTLMNRLLVGLATPGIPLIPGGLTIPATGPDPEVSVPTELQETANQTIVVPVNISTARPPGSSGMMEAVLALQYDPQIYGVSAADIQLGTVPSSGTGWQLQVAVNPQTGEIGIDLFSTTPIESTAGGSLVTVTLHVLETGGGGSSGLKLVTRVNPTGQRVYTTEVTDAQGAWVLT